MPSPPSRLNGPLGPALLVLAGLLLATAVGEIAARIAWPQVRPEPAAASQTARDHDLPTLAGMGALSTPNTLGIYNGVVHRTNSLGFRGREYAQAKPQGVFRIVVIGDSVTMGSGVDEQHVYTSRLERRLNAERNAERDAERNAPTFEVLNLGIAGLDLKWSIDGRLRKIGLPLDPDLLVYGFTLNDLHGKSYVATENLRQDPTLEAVPRGSYLFELLRIRWEYLRELLAPAPGSYVHELDYNYFDNEAAWSEFATDLGRLAEIASSREICGVVLIHTRLHALNRLHPFKRHYAKVAEAAQELGLFVIDPGQDFLGLADTSLWVSPYDSHPNARGHEILSNALLNGLEELPERCWPRRGGRRNTAPASPIRR